MLKDPSPSRDGKKLLFALRAPQLANTPPELQPTWDIWEYDRTSNKARRILSDADEDALGQDVQPAYLPDDRIVFAQPTNAYPPTNPRPQRRRLPRSVRCRQWVRL